VTWTTRTVEFISYSDGFGFVFHVRLPSWHYVIF